MLSEYRDYQISRERNCYVITRPNGSYWSEDLDISEEEMKSVIDDDINETE